MKINLLTGLVLVISAAAADVWGADAPGAAKPIDSLVLNRVRFFPAPGREKAMLGGKFSGSNRSANDGFQVLAEIKDVPAANQWTELTFANDKLYRWIRYEAPAGSFGNVAEIEFYCGSRKLEGIAYGSNGEREGRNWRRGMDGDTATWFDSNNPNNQSISLNLVDSVAARSPALKPAPGELANPVEVSLSSPTPDAEIRYTLDGTAPTATTGLRYTAPLHVDNVTTITAVAFKDGYFPSPATFGTYLTGPGVKPGLNTFHIGNSLTGTTGKFAEHARTAGYTHKYRSFTMGGAWTNKLWNIGLVEKKADWEKSLEAMPRIDLFTVQPRDFDIAEEADYDIRFFNVIRKHSPDFQPWIYVEWVESNRSRPTDKGTVPSSQMKTLYPAMTWEESMAAMLLYVEELQLKIGESYQGAKRPRVLPSALAMGWIRNMIDNGKVPGMAPGSFYPALFSDGVHPNPNGGYLVNLTWFSAFYGQSPEGKVLPVLTDLTPEQAKLMQQLAWEVVKNYPDCGLYEAGTSPVSKPEFSAPSPATAGSPETTPVTLSSATPGAWFRYTLDGTPPARTRGYVYCGVISVRPGMTVKAVAYKSGMADSPVSEATYPGK